MRAPWLSIALSACGSVNSGVPDDSAVVPDGRAALPDGGAVLPDGGGADTSVPPLDASPCVGGGFVQGCLTDLPTGPFTVAASLQIDVDRDSRCASFMPANPAWCVISGTRITVAAGATLSAISTIHRRALVLIATEAIEIDGTVDVASHIVNRAHVHGAGAQGAECVNPSDAVWPGGGAGGSFRSRGGNGGTALNTGAAGIAAAPTTTLNKLRGGCAGGNGGFSDPNPGGEGGEGGGAVYLVAPSVVVAATGVINASGSGGLIAPFDSDTGAGGGGSGGMVGLDAPDIRLAAGARLFANGGAGGEGTGCPSGGGASANGQDPISPTIPALGGRIEPNGGDGGDGATSASNGGTAGNGIANCQFPSTAGGGGGGGGGVGAIVFRGIVTDTGAQISPPSIALP